MPTLTRQNMIILAVGIAIVAIAAAVGIGLPIWKQQGLAVRIPLITEKLSDFKKLSSLEETIDAQLRELEAMHPDIPQPAPASLSLKEAEGAMHAMKAMAEKARLTSRSIVPEISGGSGAAQTLRINVKVSGTLAQVHDFLMEIMGIGYLQEMESLNIVAGDNTLDVELRFLVKTS